MSRVYDTGRVCSNMDIEYEGHLNKPDLLSLYLDVEPLYKLLHSYVRSKLNLRFPDEAYPDAKEANITQYIQEVPGNWTWMIYMCTEKTEEHLQTILHLLAHLQYFQHMTQLPFFYRQGANEAFQEAIANLFTLVFTSPTHLYAHGFGSVAINVPLTEEVQMNYLLHVAMALLPTLPYFLGLEVWRWKVYQGVYTEEEWNCEYWRLRKAMSLGASHPWPFTYRILTQQTTIDSAALLRYFRPLQEWLKEDRMKAGAGGIPGWGGELSPMGGGRHGRACGDMKDWRTPWRKEKERQ
ncbi:hypothetical protein O3P69_019251 [Scylla paramamosain]|uniref:Angiotensin-converting enzyme n=1 Tax=Scylla paramamosain TaxID=85552 RepID=A0AAW0SV19_SCYPA